MEIEHSARVELCTADGHVRRLRDIETDIINFAIDLYGGSASEVARRLCIGRSTLYRKRSDEKARRASQARRRSVSY